jgi:hypothetical protein
MSPGGRLKMSIVQALPRPGKRRLSPAQAPQTGHPSLDEAAGGLHQPHRVELDLVIIEGELRAGMSVFVVGHLAGGGDVVARGLCVSSAVEGEQQSAEGAEVGVRQEP